VTIIYALIPLGLLLLGVAIWAFFWAVRSGQFDDMETPAWRILLDDDSAPPAEINQHDPQAKE
jgi:cbb3-type cytochrome oxidase maturation protein